MHIQAHFRYRLVQISTCPQLVFYSTYKNISTWFILLWLPRHPILTNKPLHPVHSGMQSNKHFIRCRKATEVAAQAYRERISQSKGSHLSNALIVVRKSVYKIFHQTWVHQPERISVNFIQNFINSRIRLAYGLWNF